MKDSRISLFHSRTCRALALILTVVACVSQSGYALSQEQPDSSATGEPPVADSSTNPSASVGEVSVAIKSFGVGGESRPGEWTGIRIELSDTVDRPRNVIVRLSSVDPDGDTVATERAIALSGQEKVSVWLYHKLSFRSDGRDLQVTVYEAGESTVVDAAGREMLRVGRMLARLEGQGRRMLDSSVGIYGIVGPNDFDLQSYFVQASPTDAYMPFGHERAKAQQITISSFGDSFPDKWHGLAMFDLIVWGAGEPRLLRDEGRMALREWVQRGGHLVIVLPSAGQGWTNENLSGLYDIMPVVNLRRHENEDLASLKYMLTWSSVVAPPRNAVLHSFETLPEATATDAVPILKHPDGRTLVVRRIVGAGAVTWIGIDLNQAPLSVNGLSADVFWNRVIGRRGSTMDPSQFSNRDGAPIASLRQVSQFDGGVAGLINESSDSVTGMLLAFIVFIAYWLVAGPVGYAVLKARSMKQHGWLAYVMAAAVFTGIAWGGAFLLRPSKVEVTHFTILDHVHGQPLQRARMWASVLVPYYGEADISVGSKSQPSREGNSIVAWEPDSADGNVSFPDARIYRNPVSSPDRIAVPVRQTIKQVQVEWAGGPPWAMPLPTAVPGASVEGKITLLNNGEWQRDRAILDGVLTHDLPGSLTDLQIVVVVGLNEIRRVVSPDQRIRDLPVRGYAFRYSGPWNPGEQLDLSVLTTSPTIPNLQKLFTELTPRIAQIGLDPSAYLNSMDISSQMAAVSFFHMLDPPAPDNQGTYAFAARRSYTHGFDLSRWFTQPCVIILGHVGKDKPVDGPISVSVDGNEVVPQGHTLIRWIYPLDAAAPGFGALYERGMEERPLIEDPFRIEPLPADSDPGT